MTESPQALDPNLTLRGVENDTAWYDITALGVEGRGWADTEHPFDRFPARARELVDDAVWSLSQCSAGLGVRFVTDAARLSARWVLRIGNLAMDHMPATGVSGLDLYANHEGHWRFAGVGRPTQVPDNQAVLIDGLEPAPRHYMLYLPLYNGVDQVHLGVPADASLSAAPPRAPERARPICFYGTSIVQGGCASRPGMAYPAILQRRLDRPSLNLGFSGNGKAQPQVAQLLAELDPWAYVLDPLPNLAPDLVPQRLGPFIRTIREKRPRTPIVLVENIVYTNAVFKATSRRRSEESNAALHRVVRDLQTQGVADLHFVAADQLLGLDGEATVDGTHPTDLGFVRIADALEPVLRSLIG